MSRHTGKDRMRNVPPDCDKTTTVARSISHLSAVKKVGVKFEMIKEVTYEASLSDFAELAPGFFKA